MCIMTSACDGRESIHSRVGTGDEVVILLSRLAWILPSDQCSHPPGTPSFSLWGPEMVSSRDCSSSAFSLSP